jgi:hypothetical protein
MPWGDGAPPPYCGGARSPISFAAPSRRAAQTLRRCTQTRSSASVTRGPVTRARSLATGHAVADPFQRTEQLVELMALRAEQLGAATAALDATGRAIGPSEAPAR